MKFSIRNILQKRSKHDTDGHLYLRIGIPGENAPELKAYGIKVPVKDWNAEDGIVKKSHKDYAQINKKLSDGIAKYDAIFRQPDKIFSREQVREILTDKAASRGSFIQFYADYLKVQEKRHTNGYYQHLQINFNQFREIMGASVGFDDITVDLLERYETSLRGKGVAPTTLHTKTKQLREIVNRAIKRGHIEHKRVDGYKWPVYEEPETNYLTMEQTEIISNKLMSGEYDNDGALRMIAAFFLVECYSGIRFSDWSRFEVEKLVKNEALKVRALKNGQPVYLPLNVFTRLGNVIAYIKENGLIFNLTEQYTNRTLKATIQRDLGLPYPLTTHVGRHTCGTLLAEAGYSTRAIAEVLGITENTAKRYIKVTRRSLQNEFERYGGL